MECDRRLGNESCLLSHHSRLIKFLISFGNAENKNLTKILVIGKETAVEIFRDFGYLLGQELIKVNFHDKFKDFYLAPVPVAKEKLLQRGHNHSYVFAKALAKTTKLKIFTGLIKIRQTKDQASLSSQERKTNLQGAFSLKEKPPTKIILVDDIKTTGTTLKECGQLLKTAGAKEIIALTILK